ncbi:DHH family phosphoesterase [Desulfohalovibrio reitneri]|uniref:DHH family phosphoesterase n=1 Tax=Desulfohalovibrio reitneri TaxID=1307759 RepID=UPI0004A782BC|nr:DHH family phosphoesterase [Desulfohalovibrio reitneri]
MAYFRQLDDQLEQLLGLFDKDQKWLICINADPDALASAMALRRIMQRRVAEVGIAQINEVKRPDNLAMIKYLRIPTTKLTQKLASEYDHYAIVDSQPAHNPAFEHYRFSIVIDHHPVASGGGLAGAYVDIKPEYGACSTLLLEYLYNLNIEPASYLATSLLYGIKSDTQSFERDFIDIDVRAFRYLSKFANNLILKKIVRSEYRLEWLDYFREALDKVEILDHGAFVYLGEVDNPDILVILADFFLHVHEINWTAVAGTCKDTLSVIFRGDGIKQHVGEMAKDLFSDVGSAGGHVGAARAEIDLGEQDREPMDLLCERFESKRIKECLQRAKPKKESKSKAD